MRSAAKATITNSNKRIKEIDRAITKLFESNIEGKTNLRMLLKGIRKSSAIKQLTPEIVNTLIQRIEVHNNDKSGGHCYVKVDIYFTAIGMFSLPSSDEGHALKSSEQSS